MKKLEQKLLKEYNEKKDSALLGLETIISTCQKIMDDINKDDEESIEAINSAQFLIQSIWDSMLEMGMFDGIIDDLNGMDDEISELIK